MKSNLLLVSATAIMVAAFAWAGCSSDDSEGGAGAAGAAGAGKGGSAGQVNKGGANQGGSAQGGSAQGGSAQGGSAQGGSAQGGSAQGGSAQGGSAQGGAAGSGDCTGIFTGECGTCLEGGCCTELAACNNITGCVDCIGGDQASCDANNQAAVEALFQCASTSCKTECGITEPLPEVEPACDAPMATLGAGACFTKGANDTCNPVSSSECTDPGAACDYYGGTYDCYADGNTVDLCGECGTSADTFCKAGMTCMPTTGGTNKCTKFCCDDSECGTGKCDKTIAKDALPGGAGLCVGGGGTPADAGTEAAPDAP